jgi:hypothetical protein
MNKKTFAVLVSVLTFTVGVVIARLSLPRFRSAPAPIKKDVRVDVSGYRLSGPYTYENLTIFLIHAPDRSKQLLFTPLQEAMERKIVRVFETSEVNELAIENVSRTEEVLVQSGDIVKGGQQDRVLAVDLILPANSGKMPIDAFCVEHFRWDQRGQERADQFTLSEQMVATKSLKLATKHEVSQTEVWKEVDTAQAKLSAGANEDVRSELSRSSLQLAQENQKVQDSTGAYLNKLSTIVDGASDVIGFVFAINNKLNSADVYPSNAMFKRFWPKLLKTAAIEAVAERGVDDKTEVVTIKAAGEFLGASEQGTETLKEVTRRTHIVKHESEKGLFFETRDMDHQAAWIHRSYLTK